jgi:hypothetical protein
LDGIAVQPRPRHPAQGPREVNEEQVVLAEIAAEAGLPEAAVGQPADEGVAFKF